MSAQNSMNIRVPPLHQDAGAPGKTAQYGSTSANIAPTVINRGYAVVREAVKPRAAS